MFYFVPLLIYFGAHIFNAFILDIKLSIFLQFSGFAVVLYRVLSIILVMKIICIAYETICM